MDGHGLERIMSWWDQTRSHLTNPNIFKRESMRKLGIILLNNIIMIGYHFLILVITVMLQRSFIFNFPDALYADNGMLSQI